MIDSLSSASDVHCYYRKHRTVAFSQLAINNSSSCNPNIATCKFHKIPGSTHHNHTR